MSSPKFFIKASVATPSSIFTADQIIQITNYINAYRELNQAPVLSWESDISTYSQNWSNYLLLNNLFDHSGTPIYGENMTWFQGYNLDMISIIQLAIDSWYNEISSYDFSNPGFSEETGHFTNLVWVNSSSFGIGYSYDNVSDTAIVTFNNSPPGNIITEFEANVLPALRTLPIPIPIINPIPTPIIIPVVITPPLPSNTASDTTTSISSSPVDIPIVLPSVVPVTNLDKISNITNLYIILRDLALGKDISIIQSEIQEIIKDMTNNL
jgi:hypothetical protein